MDPEFLKIAKYYDEFIQLHKNSDGRKIKAKILQLVNDDLAIPNEFFAMWNSIVMIQSVKRQVKNEHNEDILHRVKALQEGKTVYFHIDHPTDLAIIEIVRSAVINFHGSTM